MRAILDLAFRAVDGGILRGASLLVPIALRGEWLREWRNELWHVRRASIPAGAFSWSAQREVAAFCLGSVADALCLSRERPAAGEHPVAGSLAQQAYGSAGQCILWLAVLLGASTVLARLLPGVQAEHDAVRYKLNPGLLMIQRASTSMNESPSITAGQFADWRATRQRFFDGFAFYRNVHETPLLPAAHARMWNVAHASPGLIPLLGAPLQFAAPAAAEDRRMPGLILTHEAFVQDFHSDPRVAGRLLRLGRRTVRIAGVLPSVAWRLPGNPDVLLIEPAAPAATSSAPGFLIAHLSPLGQAAMVSDRIDIPVRGDDDDPGLWGICFAVQDETPLGIYLFALFLALLALPAVTSVSMSESAFSSHRPSLRRRACRWCFLGAKILLIAAIAYSISLDLSYGATDSYSPTAEFFQFAFSFCICLFGFRWALADQRHRCPVCLRRVTHPANVGVASCTFLGWNGTELMCMGGHTLLHVPALPTSWFSSQRWLYLDASWEFLFAGSGMG